jgi:hypothetical protein
MASTTAQPETAIAAPWIREEAIRAERSPEVIARREREQASLEAREMRREASHRERTPLSFYTSDRAIGRAAAVTPSICDRRHAFLD